MADKKTKPQDEPEFIPSDSVDAELEQTDEPEDFERGDRRKGGAFDTLARILRGVVEVGFSNNFVIRNRPGRKIDANAKAQTGLVSVRNAFELFYRKKSDDGVNTIVIGRQGDGKFRFTNLIDLAAVYNSLIGDKEGITNGAIKLRITRDDEDPASDNTGVQLYDAGTRNDNLSGVVLRLIGQGSNGGVVLSFVDNKSDDPTASGKPWLLVDRDGIQMFNLPTSNPGGSGVVWKDGTTLRIT